MSESLVILVAVRADMPARHQAVQAVHAAFDLGRYGEMGWTLTSDELDSVSVIAYALPEAELSKIAEAADRDKSPALVRTYRDPYFGGGVTALAALDRRNGLLHRTLADYRLAFA